MCIQNRLGTCEDLPVTWEKALWLKLLLDREKVLHVNGEVAKEIPQLLRNSWGRGDSVIHHPNQVASESEGGMMNNYTRISKNWANPNIR